MGGKGRGRQRGDKDHMSARGDKEPFAGGRDGQAHHAESGLRLEPARGPQQAAAVAAAAAAGRALVFEPGSSAPPPVGSVGCVCGVGRAGAAVGWPGCWLAMLCVGEAVRRAGEAVRRRAGRRARLLVGSFVCGVRVGWVGVRVRVRVRMRG